MSVKPGGPRKELMFPIQSVTFSKHELDMVLDVITHNLRSTMTHFGRTAQFTLHLDIHVHRRGQKEKTWKKKRTRSRTPTPPKTGTAAGKTSG